MKYLILILVIALSFSCNDEEQTPEEIRSKMMVLSEQIDSIIILDCNETKDCNTLPIGNKPCGGPSSHIIFGPKTDMVLLKKRVDQYTQLNKEYNELTGATSDCSIVNPPTPSCINGVCSAEEQ